MKYFLCLCLLLTSCLAEKHNIDEDNGESYVCPPPHFVNLSDTWEDRLYIYRYVKDEKSDQCFIRMSGKRSPGRSGLTWIPCDTIPKDDSPILNP